MTWTSVDGYGSHAETSVPTPALTWYLAEGATHSAFNLFYLLQNAATVDANVQVTYLLPAPAAPLVRSYVVAANSRFNIWSTWRARSSQTQPCRPRSHPRTGCL